MNQPAFQFYPGDWLKDAALQRCSLAAQGVWIRMICLMFDSEKCGVLATKSSENSATFRAWTIPEIARVCGCKRADIQELLDNGVASRDSETGAICSKRLIRDAKLRQTRADAGSKGGSKPQAKPQAKAKQTASKHPPPSSSSSSSSSASLNTKTPQPPKGGLWFGLDIPPELDNGPTRKALAEWEKHRQGLGRGKWSELAAKKCLTRLVAFGPSEAIAAIDHSIENGWSGLFQDKSRVTNTPIRLGDRDKDFVK